MNPQAFIRNGKRFVQLSTIAKITNQCGSHMKAIRAGFESLLQDLTFIHRFVQRTGRNDDIRLCQQTQRLDNRHSRFDPVPQRVALLLSSSFDAEKPDQGTTRLEKSGIQFKAFSECSFGIVHTISVSMNETFQISGTRGFRRVVRYGGQHACGARRISTYFGEFGSTERQCDITGTIPGKPFRQFERPLQVLRQRKFFETIFQACGTPREKTLNGEPADADH